VARLNSDWLQTVRRVIEDVSTSDVSEFELVQAGFRLRLRRRVAARSPGTPQTAETVTPEAPVDPRAVQVSAPLTGIFYRSSSAAVPPYVREGDWVEAGATIGLIETMKIFNEVKIEQSGRIDRILVHNGQLVQAGDPLLTLVPGERPSREQPRL
jgi:acetyl-CoA carboxylase biotin carboxyl carrier protein